MRLLSKKNNGLKKKLTLKNVPEGQVKNIVIGMVTALVLLELQDEVADVIKEDGFEWLKGDKDGG